jgi:hypothetical protein
MPNVPVNITPPLTFRTNDSTKDSKMVNCYKETVAGKTLAVKRPGKANYTLSSPLPAPGQGLHNFNNNLYAVADGGLYTITGGTTSSVYSGFNQVNNISWVNTEPGTSPHPYMVFHDQVNGYAIDATGAINQINRQVFGVEITSGGAGYPSTGTFTVSGGPGSGATGTYVADSTGAITSATITNHGSNYIAPLTVTFSGTPITAAVAVANLNAFPTNPVPGLVYLDGYVFVMDQSATVWQSDLEDPTSWNPINYLTVLGEPDLGIGIAKHFNYLVAFKQWTTEFLYDNANPVGNVLATNTTARIELGCADGDSIQQLEETVIWMATTKEGGRIMAMLDGLQARPISNKAVETYLNASDLSGIYSWVYKISGHTFYGLVITDQNVTLVYDLQEKEWHMWTTSKQNIGGTENYFECSFVVPYPFNANAYYVLDAVNGLVFTLSPNNYVDPFGPINMRIVTNSSNLGTFDKKTNPSITLFGDKINDVINVRHTDDDYNTWSAYRQMDLSLSKPVLYNNGSFRRRAYELLYTGHYPLRLEVMESEVNGKVGQQG